MQQPEANSNVEPANEANAIKYWNQLCKLTEKVIKQKETSIIDLQKKLGKELEACAKLKNDLAKLREDVATLKLKTQKPKPQPLPFNLSEVLARNGEEHLRMLLEQQDDITIKRFLKEVGLGHLTRKEMSRNAQLSEIINEAKRKFGIHQGL